MIRQAQKVRIYPKIGLVKAVFERRYGGKIKTVTVTKDKADQYFASIIYELEACFISGIVVHHD